MCVASHVPLVEPLVRRRRRPLRLPAMIALAGLAAIFGAASLQSTMPASAHDVGTSAGAAYAVLLVATVTWTTSALGGCVLVFAVTRVCVPAIVALFVGGIMALASMSIGQTLVQLPAPPDARGRVVGIYGTSASGLRTGSGVAVGVLGAGIGVHWSLGVSAACLCLGALVVVGHLQRRDPVPA